MPPFVKRFFRANLPYALVLTCIVIAAEEIFYYYQYGTLLLGIIIVRYFFFIFCLALVLSLIRSRAVPIVVMAGLYTMLLIQALHTAYFGMPVTPEILAHFFEDPAEDAVEIFRAARELNVAVILIIAACLAASIAWIRRKQGANLSSNACIVLLALLAIFPAMIAKDSRPHRYYPHIAETLGSNFINAASLYALRNEFNTEGKTYLPYAVSDAPPAAKNIILIIGESCNPDYMSLFGYGQDTTPLLNNLKRDSGKAMVASEILSTSVTTFPSISLLMNIIREPGNIKPIQEKSHNLMYMAKAKGLGTAWLGNQTANNLIYAGIEKADTAMTALTLNPMDFKTQHDDRLQEALMRYQWKEAGNFIVIHQRNMHTPYESNYQHHKELVLHHDEAVAAAEDRKSQLRMTYENAMRYNDYTLYNLITTLKEALKDKGESYIFYTSDHGELIGEGGLFGHNHMILAMVRVPLIAYGVNANPAFMQRIKNVHTHYDLGRLIAGALGYKVENPNAEEGVYYLHSPDLYHPSRYIEYRLDAGGRVVSEQEHKALP